MSLTRPHLLSVRALNLTTIAGTSLAVLCFTVAAWLIFQRLHGAEINYARSDQAHTAQLAVETLLSTLKDAETGQRGYLLTGSSEYLEPYQKAKLQLTRDFAALEEAPFRGPTEASRISRIETLAMGKLAELAQTIQLWQSGQHDAALTIVRSNEGKRLMDAVRAEVDALQASVERSLDVTRVSHDGLGQPAAIAGLSLLGFSIMLGKIIWQSRGRRLAMLALAQLEQSTMALREAELHRERASDLLRSIVETAPGLIYAKTREGKMMLANAAVLNLIGKSWEEIEGRTDREFLPDPAQSEVIMANDRRVLETGQGEELEEVVGTEGSDNRVFLSTKQPLRDAAGRISGLVGISVEITERKRVEERQRLMVNELNHRVKNTLATVQSIASQSLRGSDPAIRKKLETRLQALATAHDVLTRESWEGANLLDIVGGVLAPHGGIGDRRFQVRGPNIRLAPKAAVALALGVHELGTNALKYGALSVDNGRVEIDWRLVKDGRFVLVWTEYGGPEVQTPTRRGFGTTLIERSLAIDLGGTSVLHFEPTGVVCVIEAPLSEVIAATAAAYPLVGVV